MMTTLILYFGYNACQSGEFQCDYTTLPDISHVMGHAPLNKLYAIMLTIYACTKQAYVRSFYTQLSPLTHESKRNTYMVYYGIVSIVFGPLIGFYDVYYNMQVHCLVAGLFTIAELCYIFTMVSILTNNRSFFTGS